ncbi:MAG TPA: zinc-dependent alcohol dehydrogenase [Streptosporangiaceae bacterium]|jgi:threonine dehydrogenase-like Zn-dependent dehydrogenase|nr:zinc-dependent alcohol dehydrogenase [Streptosporangiaceae bacterium]
MRALTWQGTEHVEVTNVPDPKIQEPNDIVIRVTSTAICGSDLHLYGVLGPFLAPGDVLGHEAMGIVEEVGGDITHLRPGDRVVVPFNISCGHCWMCRRGLFAQCETTQVRAQGKGAALFGYTSLYGSVPGGQAQYLRVPQAQFGPIKIPDDAPDEQYLYLSDILPTAYQAVAYADVPDGGTLAVLGLGPVGQLAVRVARHLGVPRVIGVDPVPERRGAAQRFGVETLDPAEPDDTSAALIELVDGRGPDAVIDAVGMEAHGHDEPRSTRFTELAQKATGLLPDAAASKFSDKAAVDRLDALHTAVKAIRRGGTVSVSGVYGGEVDPMPMMEMFDRGIQLRMGQAHVKRWIDELMPMVSDESDPLGLRGLATHRLPLADAPRGYEIFRDKAEGCLKVVLQP